MRVFTLLLLFGILSQKVPASAKSDSFPVPPVSANRLFYIQRSTNTNTVVYEANLSSKRTYDVENPVNVYWIRYAENGQREQLSSFQWQMAYGYKHGRTIRQADEIDIQLNAFKKRAIRVAFRQGKPVALASINGKQAYLQKIFVQVASSGGLIPKVDYIELFGTDPELGKPLYERITL